MKKILSIFFIVGVMFAKQSVTVFGASPPATYFLYSLNPDLIAGINYTFVNRELEYLKKDMNKLPLIGGWFGQGNTPNFETLIKVNPDLVVTWNFNNSFKKVDDKLHSLGFKTFSININSLEDYTKAYKDLGLTLGLKSRAEQLSLYTKKSLDELKSLKKRVKEKKSVYYAEGADGLQTECDSSVHADLIEYVGAINPHKCPNKAGFGRERISLEQLIIYDPDIIITQEENFYKNVYKDEKMLQLKAVKNRNIYFIPKSPFSWFDRPPSFMKILGAQWLGNIVYKDIYNIDIEKRVKEFYKLFLNVSLSDNQVKNLLEGE